MFSLSKIKVPQIDSALVHKAIETHQKFILLDVRTAGEHKKNKISSSINLPVDLIADKITSTIPDKETTIYVYCLSGSRSEPAVQTMLSLGYKNVFNITSGLLAWRAKGYKLEQ